MAGGDSDAVLPVSFGQDLEGELGAAAVQRRVAEGASALFQVIAQRYTKTSTIVTTNRPITSWDEVLGDTTVAAALLDHLPHRRPRVSPSGIGDGSIRLCRTDRSHGPVM